MGQEIPHNRSESSGGNISNTPVRNGISNPPTCPPPQVPRWCMGFNKMAVSWNPLGLSCHCQGGGSFGVVSLTQSCIIQPALSLSLPFFINLTNVLRMFLGFSFPSPTTAQQTSTSAAPVFVKTQIQFLEIHGPTSGILEPCTSPKWTYVSKIQHQDHTKGEDSTTVHYLWRQCCFHLISSHSHQLCITDGKKFRCIHVGVQPTLVSRVCTKFNKIPSTCCSLLSWQARGHDAISLPLVVRETS